MLAIDCKGWVRNMEALREGMRGETVEVLKRRLDALGYDCGAGDEYDRRTAWAVRWFCKRNGMEESYEADDEVLKRLYELDAAKGPVDDAWQYYSMKDETWAKYPYDAANTPEIEVIENSACGPTSMAMAVSTLLHRAVLPPVLADWSNAHGYRDPNGIDGTSDDFFPACAEQYGLRAELKHMDTAEEFAKIEQDLADGCVVICNVVPGSPYTSCGHYNLIQRIRDGRVHISDPVPKNCLLPDYTVEEWLEKKWGRHCLVVRK